MNCRKDPNRLLYVANELDEQIGLSFEPAKIRVLQLQFLLVFVTFKFQILLNRCKRGFGGLAYAG
jgi:hypothetical protein